MIGRPASPEAEPPVVATLPFAVRLDAFEIDYYEGTRRPAQFRSRVTVKDAAPGETPAVIEMNHELAYGGYKFFQSSYRETPDRDQTILSVSKDPGEPIVFLGYYGLVAGMIIVLVDAHPRAAPGAPAGRGGARVLALLAAAPGLGAARAAPAVRRRRRGAAPPPGAARRPRHAARHARPRGGLERHRQAERVGRRPRGDGPRLGLRPAGLGDPADRAREGRPPGRRDRPPRGHALVLVRGPGRQREAHGADERGARPRSSRSGPWRPSRRRRRSWRGGSSGCSGSSTRSVAARRARPRSPATRGRCPSTLHSAADLRAVLDSGVVGGAPAAPSGPRSRSSTTAPAPRASRGGC